MNAAFEDCLVMNQCIGQYGDDWETTFMEYQRSRKRNTDALADLSLRNFDELRESVKSPSFVARKQLDIILNRLFPNTWIPLYTLISHSVIPYADAIERVERQQRLVKMMGLELILSTFARVMSVLNFIKNLPVYFREKMTADRYQTLQLKPSSPKRTFNTNLVTDQSEPLS
jgi:hypothetical protein